MNREINSVFIVYIITPNKRRAKSKKKFANSKIFIFTSSSVKLQ